MVILLSPSKTMDFTHNRMVNHTLPAFLPDAILLNKILRKLKHDELSNLLATSAKLTDQSHSEIKAFDGHHSTENAKTALLSYSGDVYGGLEAHAFNDEQLYCAGKQILILSGLYGVLRGTDLIQAYRLDISAPIVTKAGKTLYPYWKSKITHFINHYLVESGHTMILNLASDEYAKAIDWKQINSTIINVDFLEEKNGVRKVISFNAKRARGIMASLIIKKKIDTVESLQKLTIDGYSFDKISSQSHQLVFVKKSK